MCNSWIMCFVYLINFKMQENQRIECLKGWPLNQWMIGTMRWKQKALW